MPLPRPIGDPFVVVKDEPQTPGSSSNTNVNGKRPISASAFSFSLGPKSASTSRTKLEPISISAGVSLSKGKQRAGVEEMDMDTPIRRREMTPMKSNFKLDSLPSLHTPLNKKRVTDSSIAHHSLQTPQDRKRINDHSFIIPSAKKGKEEKPLVSLGNIGKVELDGIHVEAVKKRVEEEGLGVSPRGKKIIKYHGKG
jgi:hypothetical protein